ncbi:hypothetical protein OIU78_019132 [Salix suchowensis]|nr:hypothetical protein OIU78_019132 [Salix suchowensis]
MQQSYDSSLAPWWVLTRHFNLSMARCLKALLLVKRTAHPPDRNKQLARIIDLSLPEYQLGLKDSEVTTSA